MAAAAVITMKQGPSCRRQKFTHWNAAQARVDAEGTLVPYASLSDLLVDLLEDTTPLATDLCLLVIDMMDVVGFTPLPRGVIAQMPPEPLELNEFEVESNHDDDVFEPDSQTQTHTGYQIRFRGGGCLIFPKECQLQLANFKHHGACKSNAPNAVQGKRFLFFREFPLSIELMGQDGQPWRLQFAGTKLNINDGGKNKLSDLLDTPLREQDRRLRVFYGVAGQCEYRMQPCRAKVDDGCENACCNSAHCATYTIQCPHHDGSHGSSDELKHLSKTATGAETSAKKRKLE